MKGSHFQSGCACASTLQKETTYVNNDTAGQQNDVLTSTLFDDQDNNPIVEITKYATANPDARLRMLLAVYDISALTNALVTSLIAEELQIADEATASPLEDEVTAVQHEPDGGDNAYL